MAIELRKLQFQSERLPCTIHLVIADAETRKESAVWITARFPLGERSTDRLSLLALEALDELQKLIEQGRANAAREPGTQSQ